jgi:hypothetical protein
MVAVFSRVESISQPLFGLDTDYRVLGNFWQSPFIFTSISRCNADTYDTDLFISIGIYLQCVGYKHIDMYIPIVSVCNSSTYV